MSLVVGADRYSVGRAAVYHLYLRLSHNGIIEHLLANKNTFSKHDRFLL